jgi:hypothetical protein
MCRSNDVRVEMTEKNRTPMLPPAKINKGMELAKTEKVVLMPNGEIQ